MLVPDLQARVTLLDGGNNVVAHLGDDPDWRDQVMKMEVRKQRSAWRDGRSFIPTTLASTATETSLSPSGCDWPCDEARARLILQKTRTRMIRFGVVLCISVALVAPCRGEEVLFEDNFDDGLSEHWKPVGIAEGDFRIRDGGLELRVAPGKVSGQSPRSRLKCRFSLRTLLLPRSRSHR